MATTEEEEQQHIKYKKKGDKEMKKIVFIFMVAVLMMGFSGKAMAAFTNGDLIRVVYQDNGTVEVATDLGAFSATTPITSNIQYSANHFSTSMFGTGFADLYVGYFITNGTFPQAWTSGPLTGQTSLARMGSPYLAAAASVLNYYSYLGGGASQVTGNQTDVDSYVYAMDKSINNGAYGVMGGLFTPSNNADTSLAALGTGASYVDCALYYYDTNTTAAGLNIATIETLSNGTTELVSAAPVPAAIYLLGSGLVGLVGMRRKMIV